ncbi:photosystem II protein PsbQ [Synechocystis sp. LKSZ1]|uniref:photosystem II protein PsbQ n=1 Tax=Synechocystis sp. LKSZ1 TaxID=3144951 RepID=UPI00336C0EC0
MSIFRSLFSLLLVIVATVLVACSGPQVQIPTTYSPEKIAQLEVYVTPIESAREKMETLKTLISDQNWVNIRTYIHGPLGQLRQDMLNLSRSLLPKDQDQATALAREVFGHLERLDVAAKDRSLTQAGVQYREALEDFDAFLNLIPKAS